MAISPAAEVGHGHRYCHWNRHEKAHRHIIHPDQRPLRPPKLLQTKRRFLVLAASGASDQDVWGAYGCNFSWRFQWHRFVPFNFLLSLAAPHLYGVLVLTTGNKFTAGDNDTGDNCSLVSMTPVRNLSPVSTTPESGGLVRHVWNMMICLGIFGIFWFGLTSTESGDVVWHPMNLAIWFGICPASQVKKTKVRPDYSSAPTQLALCLRLATT